MALRVNFSIPGSSYGAGSVVTDPAAIAAILAGPYVGFVTNLGGATVPSGPVTTPSTPAPTTTPTSGGTGGTQTASTGSGILGATITATNSFGTLLGHIAP